MKPFPKPFPETRQSFIRLLAAAGAVAAMLTAPPLARADEGGVSFWFPGLYGSLAAAPQQPGWSLGMIYLHDSVSAGGDVARARAITIGRFNPLLNTSISASLDANLDVGLFSPTYVFATPVLGGQAAVSMAALYGRNSTSLNGTISSTLFTALGPIPLFATSFSDSDARTAFGDLYPEFSLRWNSGVHNWMTYVIGDIPVGAYDPSRLANLGIGHGAIDAGGAYTYFNPQTGNEFSATLGFTYNFENPDTQYQNGIDSHLDWGASKFVTKQLQLGVVGYAYQQISCDSGAGDKVGCFRSRVFGAGPQIGYIIPLSEHLRGYVNLKGYKDFGAENRPEGWNVWLTFAISPAAPETAPPKAPLLHK